MENASRLISHSADEPCRVLVVIFLMFQLSGSLNQEPFYPTEVTGNARINFQLSQMVGRESATVI
jgi:hypothetical protein